VKEELDNIVEMGFIPGKRWKEDRLSAVYNGLVEVFLLS